MRACLQVTTGARAVLYEGHVLLLMEEESAELDQPVLMVCEN